MAYLLLYVNDMVLTTSMTSLLQHFVQRLRSPFTVKDMGPVHYFLSINVKHNKNGFTTTEIPFIPVPNPLLSRFWNRDYEASDY
jgi:hypothetical protein